ncbi:MAG: hypothetical protein PHU27_09485 [Salinivirgaceae bacterium]|nr:hypothetical protein [Salinivirgaceae bacterium]MDD4747335.1 hypothetical protein [Salinivirgaceae bacterium]MDY0282650.1 hypothetical protein [Salinivirgaceae bacterium]
MKADFLCPNCYGFLNVNEKLVFAVKKKGQNGGVFLFSPSLGDYSISHHHSFETEDGEQVDFHCPICNHNLSVEDGDKFARVLLREDDKEYFVVFSKTKGERCTYKMSNNQIEASYGDHFVNHFDFVSALFFK